MLSGLKALGNLGFFSSKVQDSVSECIRSTVLPIPVRLAAIEAFRNNPCNMEMKQTFMEILEDKNQDNEVRIAAYLAVMRCPCSPTLVRIEKMLAIEEFNQGRIHQNSFKKPMLLKSIYEQTIKIRRASQSQ